MIKRVQSIELRENYTFGEFFRQHIKTKKHKFGIKCYKVCEPKGTALKIMVCSGYVDSEIAETIISLALLKANLDSVLHKQLL